MKYILVLLLAASCVSCTCLSSMFDTESEDKDIVEQEKVITPPTNGTVPTYLV